jgi:hypothetical protein
MFSGCATTTVLRRPPRKNLDLVKVGESRGAIIAELGAPAYTKDVAGEKTDTFAFDKGVGGGYRFARAFFHTGADIMTLFLWEIVGWPAEKIAAKPNTTVEVAYNTSEKVTAVSFIKK